MNNYYWMTPVLIGSAVLLYATFRTLPKRGSSMRLFRLDEYVWYCGKDAEEAIAAHMADTGVSREDATDEMFFGEVTGDDLDAVLIDEDTPPNKKTLRETVAEMTCAQFVCGIDG